VRDELLTIADDVNVLSKRWRDAVCELCGHFERSRARLSSLGAVCGAGYVVAAITQRIIRAFFVAANALPAQAMLLRCQTADLFRATLVLLSIFMSLVVFAAIAINRVKRAPGAVLLGLASGVVFVGLEVWYRSIDLFLVSLHWAREFRDANVETVKQQLLERTTEWERLVEALYFPLLVALLLTVASFALALAGDRRRWARLAALGWTLYGTSILLRILGGYVGLGWLEPFNIRAYLPCAAAGYGLSAIWLWREGRAPAS
jgi:hypothetical protein